MHRDCWQRIEDDPTGAEYSGGGVFRASKDVIEGRMKLSGEWSEAMTTEITRKEFKDLPERIQKAIIADVEARKAPETVPLPDDVECIDGHPA